MTTLLPVERATKTFELTPIVLPVTPPTAPAVTVALEPVTWAVTLLPMFDCRLDRPAGAVPVTAAERLIEFAATLPVDCASTVLFEADSVELDTTPAPEPLRARLMVVVLVEVTAPMLAWSFSTAYWPEARDVALLVDPNDPAGIV